MKVNTTPGATYALTCTAACTVRALLSDASSLTILETENPGQYIFVAPTDTVEVSDEHALVTQTFKAAAMGSSAQGGGIRNGQDATLNNLKAATINCEGPVTFSKGITMDELFVSSSYIRCKGFATSDGYVSFSSSNTEGRLVIASGKMFIGNTLSRRNVSIECLSVGMKTYTSLTKTMAGDIGLTGNSLLNMTEGDARWLKVRTDLSDAEYAALEEKDVTTLYITTDGGKIYLGTHVINQSSQ